MAPILRLILCLILCLTLRDRVASLALVPYGGGDVGGGGGAARKVEAVERIGARGLVGGRTSGQAQVVGWWEGQKGVDGVGRQRGEDSDDRGEGEGMGRGRGRVRV